MNSSSEKVSYIPSEINEVSKDPISQERIGAVEHAYGVVQRQLPDVVVFTLGGSLAKGKRLTPEIAERTDVDLYHFVDPEQAVDRLDELTKLSPQFAAAFSEATAQGKDVRSSAVKAALSVVDAALEIPLSEGRTLNEIRGRHFNVDNKVVMQGEGSILYYVDWYKYNRHEADPNRQGARRYVSRRFQMDIGGGMKRYIQGFLNQIGEKDMHRPGVADAYWALVRDALDVTDRVAASPRRLPSDFPLTFKEARIYYGL
jgi:hypothetical protein